jgi:hypothetical protein
MSGPCLRTFIAVNVVSLYVRNVTFVAIPLIRFLFSFRMPFFSGSSICYKVCLTSLVV